MKLLDPMIDTPTDSFSSNKILTNNHRPHDSNIFESEIASIQQEFSVFLVSWKKQHTLYTFGKHYKGNPQNTYKQYTVYSLSVSSVKKG